MFRFSVLAIVVCLAVGACSDEPLADVGHVTNDWIGSPQVTEPISFSTTTSVPVYKSASDVVWFNDPLTGDDEPVEDAIETVWKRREAGNKYVQASRMEIAGALPGVAFPNLLPDDIKFISSQLLFDGDGTLANDFVAAFGMWTAEPYTVSRSVGQYAILWITVPDPDTSGCERFRGRDISECETVVYEGETAWRLTVAGSNTLVWIDDGFQYELFHRPQIDVETALMMSRAMVSLEDLSRTSASMAAGA